MSPVFELVIRQPIGFRSCGGTYGMHPFRNREPYARAGTPRL